MWRESKEGRRRRRIGKEVCGESGGGTGRKEGEEKKEEGENEEGWNMGMVLQTKWHKLLLVY